MSLIPRQRVSTTSPFVPRPVLIARAGVMVRMSITLAAIGGTCLFVHAAGLGPNGLFQRAGLLTLDVWMIAFALRLGPERRESASYP